MAEVRPIRVLAAAMLPLALVACGGGSGPELPPAQFSPLQEGPSQQYVIGPLDQLNVNVWRNPELSVENVQVRPDGRITLPLVSDMPAVGKTTAMLEEDIRLQLSQYIQDPIVSIMVTRFAANTQQVRVIGATEQPASIPYRANLTVLDAMIAVGGLSEFARGNRARLIRTDPQTGQQREYRLRLDDLLEDGDTSANVLLMAGDVVIIPQSNF